MYCACVILWWSWWMRVNTSPQKSISTEGIRLSVTGNVVFSQGCAETCGWSSSIYRYMAPPLRQWKKLHPFSEMFFMCYCMSMSSCRNVSLSIYIYMATTCVPCSTSSHQSVRIPCVFMQLCERMLPRMCVSSIQVFKSRVWAYFASGCWGSSALLLINNRVLALGGHFMNFEVLIPHR